MHVEVSKKLFTVDEYYLMGEVGIIGPEERTELIDGEIIQTSPPGNRHIGACNRANTLFTEALGRRVIVSVQNPLLLDKHNEPQPDIIVLKPTADFYGSRRATPKDASLVIEIAMSSLGFDRKVKLPHYARCGVPEVWIEDLNNDLLLVFRDPSRGRYKTSMTLGKGEKVSPLAFPDVSFKVEDLLG
jgi:Uma2 family endonuclease